MTACSPALWGFQLDLVYDREKIIQLLINRDEMSREEAIEFYMYNIECLTGMTGGPLFVTRSESIMEGV